MFEDKYIYVVHSDTDENNIYAEFDLAEEAIEYARDHKDDLTYVERVYCETDPESGEITDVYETEVVWSYDEEEDLDEFLDAKVNVDFDGGDNNDVRVLSSFDPETEGEPLDEFLDADINLSIDGGTGNKVGVLSPGLNLGEAALSEILDADIDLNLDGGTGNTVNVLDKSLSEEAEEPKWNIGSNKLVSRFSQEYKNLEKLADMLEAQAGSNETYVVDRTYEDYGAGMEWYTIIHICDLERDDSYQLLSPKQWIYLANTGDVEGVYENIINKKPLKEEAVTLAAPKAEGEEIDPAIESRFTVLDLTKDEEIKVDSEILDENIDKMLEELEEHEDEVECQSCFELVAKESCTKNEKGHYICEKCGHSKEELKEEWDFEESLTESQAQEISSTYTKLSKDFGIDLEDLVWGENGFMMTHYPEGFPDFSGDVIYSEKYWEELVKFAESKGISLAADVYADEKLDEHIQDRPEPIETEQELKGTDNAVVDCEVADIITHSEDEKPLEEEADPRSIEARLEKWLSAAPRRLIINQLPGRGMLARVKNFLESKGYKVQIVEAAKGYVKPANENTIIIYDDIKLAKDNFNDILENTAKERAIFFSSQGGRLDSKFHGLDEAKCQEETHAQFAKPEGNRVQAYNNALKYAKQYNKEFIYGYTNHTGKFFALDQPIKVTGTARDAEKEFRNKYKNCGVVYMVYPNKTFIKEEAELEN